MIPLFTLPALLLQAAGGFSDLTWALILMGLGVILYIIEVSNPGFFLAIPGTVLVVAGFIMVINPALFQQPWSWFAIIVLSALSTWGTIEVYKRLAPPEKSNTTIGIQNVVGLFGKAETDVTTTSGTVTVQGESWRALAQEGSIALGSKVEVVGTEGSLTVIVRKTE